MQIDLVYPILPPAINGIGDYTAHMARALSELGADVRVLTGRDQQGVIPGVEVVPSFSVAPRLGIFSLVDAVSSRPPDWLIIQFEQFSYGRWGLNPYLPLALRNLRRSCPNTRIALMAHEDFVSATERPEFAVMSLWQRPQFWALGRLSDHVFLSIDTWAQRYASWFPHAPVEHLPVGSNIPRLGCSRREARNLFQIPTDAFVIGMFGSAHPSRRLDRIGAALAHLRAHHPNLCALYVGTAGASVKRALPDDIPLYDLGPRPAEDVSASFEAMDLYFAPFQDGVSTRRGSFLVGLQHEVPTLSTSGHETDPLLATENESAFVLVPWNDEGAFLKAAERLAGNAEWRDRMAAAAGTFFANTFSWPRLAGRLLMALFPNGKLPARFFSTLKPLQQTSP
jgi:glycosyltransferase involved in cell wall biosynthesis